MNADAKFFTLMMLFVLLVAFIYRKHPEIMPDHLVETGKPPEAAKHHKPFQAQTWYDTSYGPSYLVYNTPPWSHKPPIGNVLPQAGLRVDCPPKAV